MHPIKIRKVGRELLLAIPVGIAEKVQAEYMIAQLDVFGRLIYTPLQEPAE